jgi:hypothetical protein
MFVRKKHQVAHLSGIRTVPLWMQAPFGIVFAGITLLFAVLAVGLPFESLAAKAGAHDFRGALMLAFVLSLLCISTGKVSLRLFRRRENFVAPSTPRTIRIVSFYYLALSLASAIGLFRGDVTLENCAVFVFPLLYFFVFQYIANTRQQQIHNQSTDPAP